MLKTRGLPSGSFFAAYVGESIVTEWLLKTLSTTFRCRSITFQDAPGDGGIDGGWNWSKQFPCRCPDQTRIGLRIQPMVGHEKEDGHSLGVCRKSREWYRNHERHWSWHPTNAAMMRFVKKAEGLILHRCSCTNKAKQSQRKMIYSNSNDSLDNVNRAKLLNGANVATLPDVQWMKSLL